ncbi:MAG: molecular chaperone TorD family protein [Chloroflexi bacterium]|nr:molecular chaperone TorD family protein [Chloroflexota bacterium]
MMTRRHSPGDQAQRGKKPLTSHFEGLAVEDLALFRQVAYRLFSQSLLYPDEARLAMLATVAGEIGGWDEGLWGFAFAPGWSRLLSCLKESCSPSATHIESEYVSLFLANEAGVPCPIYESAYLGEDPSATGLLLGQLEKEYRLMGLSPSPDLKEPPDHAAVELEFMAFLCSREAEAWGRQTLAEAIRAVEAERVFLASHLTRWFPGIAGRVAAVARESRFAVITESACSFSGHDCDLLAALLERFQGVSVETP